MDQVFLYCVAHLFFLIVLVLRVVLCVVLRVVLRVYTRFVAGNEINRLAFKVKYLDALVKRYQQEEIRVKKVHDKFVEIVKQTCQKSRCDSENRLQGIIDSLNVELRDAKQTIKSLTEDREDTLIAWLELHRHAGANDWIPEHMPEYQLGPS
jgi:hypothetical protein